MEHRRKIAAILAILTVAILAGTVAYAVFTTTQNVPMGITIMGSQSFAVYTDAALTQPYTGGALTYGSVMQGATVAKTAPLYCVNTGQMPLQVSFASSTLPTGITWACEYSTNGFSTYAPLTPNTQITVPAGGQIDFGFDLNLATPAFGSYSWTTTLTATGS